MGFLNLKTENSTYIPDNNIYRQKNLPHSRFLGFDRNLLDRFLWHYIEYFIFHYFSLFFIFLPFYIILEIIKRLKLYLFIGEETNW